MTRPVRFIHAADLHLDAPFKGIDAADPRVRSVLVDSTYVAFDAVVSAAIEREVDFLVLAGDVYNAADRSVRAQLRFADGMRRLADAGVEVFIAHGNHDPANGWSARLPLPPSVHVFSHTTVERLVVEREGEPLCSLYGRSFGTAAETANLARGFVRQDGEAVSIGVLHANVGGDTEYEPYAPCSLEDLRAAGMDYWALGHIHKPSRLSDKPRVNYAGSPQGLNPKEDGEHGCLLVEIAGGVVSEELLPTAAVRWARLTVEAGALSDLEAVHDALRSACIEVAGEGDIPVSLRIDLVGRSEAHADLAREDGSGATALAQIVSHLRLDLMSRQPWLWVDRVRDLTSATVDLEALRAQEDFVGDLVRLADGVLADEVAIEAMFAEVIDPVRKKVGGSAVDLDPRTVLERARDLCLDRLLAEDGAR